MHPFVAFPSHLLNVTARFASNALYVMYSIYIVSKTKLQVFLRENFYMFTATNVARRAKFKGVFAKIRDELVEHLSEQGTPYEAVEWYRNVRTSFDLLNIPWLNTWFFLP